MSYLIHILVNALALLFTAYVVPGVTVRDFPTSLLAAVVLSLLNLIVKPTLTLLTLPITFITFGLFTFVINAILLLLTAHFISGFHVQSFWSAILGSIVISIVSTIVNKLIGE